MSTSVMEETEMSTKDNDEPGSVPVQVRVPRGAKREMERAAKKNGETLSAWARRVLSEQAQEKAPLGPEVRAAIKSVKLLLDDLVDKLDRS